MIAKFYRKFRSLLSAATNRRACNFLRRPLAALVLRQPVLLGSIIITVLLQVRQLGSMQPLELAAFDQMVRLQADAGPDPRLW